MPRAGPLHLNFILMGVKQIFKYSMVNNMSLVDNHCNVLEKYIFISVFVKLGVPLKQLTLTHILKIKGVK